MAGLLRLLTILRTVARYRLTDLLPSHLLSKPARLGLWLCGLGSRQKDLQALPAATRLRLALQDLGPIYIKFGQLLSTRRDMLPEDIADELALLQDRVKPFDGPLAQKIIEEQLGQPVDAIFSNFDVEPLASASVAQVHTAQLIIDGSDVVIKVIRPDILPIIERDITLLFFLARTLERYSSEARRLHLVDIINDYQTVILGELDLKQEAANASQLRHNFESDADLNKLLRVPKVYWDHITETILVMERMYGIPVSEIEQLKSHNTNFQVLAERGVEIFFTQVFEHNFFHADMHPGNILVDVSDPEQPKYIALDCAIMGSMSDLDRYYVARILLGALDRDYRLVTQLYRESGWLNADVKPAAFESLIRGVCEPIFSKPLAELSFGTLLIYLFQAARRFGMEIQPEQVLLQKTLVNIEGLGQQLYPELDLWQTAKPFLDRWTAQRYSPTRVFEGMQERLPTLLETLPSLQDSLMRKLHQIGQGKSADSERQQRLTQLEQSLHQQKRYNIILLVVAVMALGTFLSS
ncbi:MAG: 2-polyprenylphenol 6-hydroxylase [Pseudomonadales bacterium]|nr:2-polyprenylphenol 6-hydroxylase [Pseudomonadales bacterium]